MQSNGRTGPGAPGAARGTADRSARVERIAQQVKQGTYRWPDARQIALGILDDADLTARLKAMFNG
jgi:hypothetical protein